MPNPGPEHLRTWAEQRTLLQATVQYGVSGRCKVLDDGCRPDRETARAIEDAGFIDVDPERIFGPPTVALDLDAAHPPRTHDPLKRGTDDSERLIPCRSRIRG